MLWAVEGSWQHGGMGALRPHTVDRKPAPEAVAQRECTTGPPAHGRAAVDAEREGSGGVETFWGCRRGE